MLAREIGIKLG